MQSPRMDLARDPTSSQKTYYVFVCQQFLRTRLGSTNSF